MSGLSWAALALLFGYLALFFWGSAIAAKAAGKPVWLFARAAGRDRLAAMGASWRVGVVDGETGDLVTGGLYRFSRNPTFVGQFALLAGVALAVPAVPTTLAPILFLWSAATQVRSEEAALRQTLGSDYDRYATSVPRWIGFRRREVP